MTELAHACPACEAPILDADVDEEKRVAECLECGARVHYGHTGERWWPIRHDRAEEVELPEWLEVVDEQSSPGITGYRGSTPRTARLVLRWSHHPDAALMSCFTVVLLGVMLLLSMFALSMFAHGESALFLLPVAAFAVAALRTAWLAAVARWNHTEISLRDGALHVETGPLVPPWYRAVVVPLPEVERFVTFEAFEPFQPLMPVERTGGFVFVRKRGSKRAVPLVGYLDAPAARYVARRLEAHRRRMLREE